MSIAVDFRVLELLCGRLCHELVSPVGAINNGVELLDEEDPEFVKEAMTLIGQSARKAGQRLQFYRFAYGTGGGGRVDGGELAAGLLEGAKVRCDWASDVAAMAPSWQRLACNMLVLAAEALPRGGMVRVRASGSGVEVAAEGDTVTISEEIRAMFEATVALDLVTPRTVHAYYTACLAREMGARLALAAAEPGHGVLTALPAG
jgi:histidine phosphotransferase ChpT